jgi:hypothetical protein
MAHPNNPLCFWTNLLMLLPAALALRRGLRGTAAALLVCMGCSMMYHLDEDDPRGLVLDVASVVCLVACLFLLCFGMPHALTPMNTLAAVYGLMASYCFLLAQEGIVQLPDGREEFTDLYERYHTSWHILTTCMTAAIIYSHSEGGTVLTRPLPLPTPPPLYLYWFERSKKEGSTSGGIGAPDPAPGPAPGPAAPGPGTGVGGRNVSVAASGAVCAGANSSLSRSNTALGTRCGPRQPVAAPSRCARLTRRSRSRMTSRASSRRPMGSGSRVRSRWKRSSSAATMETASSGSNRDRTSTCAPHSGSTSKLMR